MKWQGRRARGEEEKGEKGKKRFHTSISFLSCVST